MGGGITKKDVFWICLAAVLAGGIWFASTRVSHIKNAFDDEPFAASGNPSQEPIRTSDPRLKLASPRPDWIIKGTSFTLKGQAVSDIERLLIRLSDKNNETLVSDILDRSTKTEGWNEFESIVDAKNFNGFAIVEIFSFPQNELLNRFQIRIIKSI